MEKKHEVIQGSAVPFAFDASYYTARYSELRDMENMAAGHFIFSGIAQGRQGHPRGNRPQFIEYVNGFSSVLEVGPFYNPTACGENVRYLDVLDEKQLRARAELLGFDVNGCPERIHYVGEIFDINETFDAVVSSHCIEHQPDLVHHLQGVARVLQSGGRYLLLVPDKRYCFDHFIPETTLADVMQAHSERRTIHTLRSVIEHYALTTHNNAHAHWAGDHGEQFPVGQIDRVKDAIRTFNESSSYIDVHSWTFTPSSFFFILNALYDLGLTRLKPVEIYPTLYNELEFFAVLELQDEITEEKDDLILPIRGEGLRVQDNLIADLRRRLDQAEAEKRDAQAELVERQLAPRTGFLSRISGLSGPRP
jgi:SAM-dependent methyltransferase